MTIRKLREEDVGILLSSRKDFPDGWNENMISSAFKGGRFKGFIAEENHDVLGYITLSKGLDGEYDIESVFTFPSHRRRGVATMLLGKLLSTPYSKIFLEVREKNAPAVRLYKKAGFKQISVRKKYYPDGENAIIMILENENK